MTEEQAIGRIAKALGEKHSGLDSRAWLLALTAWQTMREIALEDRTQAQHANEGIRLPGMLSRTSEA